ncbi:hypothetical protein U9M48_007679 [Paspalum notatum var. saurae]|uniref:Uncharacterized protein n=1 Tax=Paspalum notatum var. saurae TaxID=547442 RepID=A0AAQ3SMU6_PASNO
MPPPETGTGREQMGRRFRRDLPWYYGLPGARFHLLHEVGDGFVWWGAVPGSAFYFLKGLRNSPSGGRLAGAASAVRLNAPRFAGSMGAFIGLISGFEMAVSLGRGKKEDDWNWIAASAAASATLDVRQGARAAARSALVWGAFAALVQGGVIALTRHPVFLPPVAAAEGRRPALPHLDATVAGHLHAADAVPSAPPSMAARHPFSGLVPWLRGRCLLPLLRAVVSPCHVGSRQRRIRRDQHRICMEPPPSHRAELWSPTLLFFFAEEEEAGQST